MDPDIAAELHALDATIATLARLAAAAAPVESSARRRWRHRRAWMARSAGRAGRMGWAIMTLRALPGYQRVKLAPGRWAIEATTPDGGRATVAHLDAPTLRGGEKGRPRVEVVVVGGLPPSVLATLAHRAALGTFTLTGPSPARKALAPR